MNKLKCGKQEKRPACFLGESEKEEVITWWNWNDAAISSNPGPSSFCNDCQPWYESEMIRIHMCEHPGTTFRQDNDGSVYGKGDENRGLVGIRPTHSKRPQDVRRESFPHPDGKVRQRSNAAFSPRPISVSEADLLGSQESSNLLLDIRLDDDTY